MIFKKIKTRAAFGLTLRFPPLVALAVQAEKLPLSKPSAKIKYETAEIGEGMKVGVGEDSTMAV